MTANTSPPPHLDPESVHRAYLSADIRPAIRAATCEQMRDILHHINEHLCHQLSRDIGGFAALGPDRRRPGEICQVGAAKSAGIQLYQQVIEAVAASYLHALGFDPGRAGTDPGYFAASVAPFLATASRQQLRRKLIHLTDHMRAVLGDADKFGQASTGVIAEVTGELWEIATGVGAAIALYRHCAQVLSVHVLYFIWECLDIGNSPCYSPYVPAPDDAQVRATTLN